MRVLRDLRELTLTPPGKQLTRHGRPKNGPVAYLSHHKTVAEKRRIAFNMLVSLRAPEEVIYLVARWAQEAEDA